MTGELISEKKGTEAHTDFVKYLRQVDVTKHKTELPWKLAV